MEIPKVSTDLGSDLYFVKLPNFLSVEPRSEVTLPMNYTGKQYRTVDDEMEKTSWRV